VALPVSYATAGIAIRVSGELKPHHHDKVGIALVGSADIQYVLISIDIQRVRNLAPGGFAIQFLDGH
jgi:hypothetical protein